MAFPARPADGRDPIADAATEILYLDGTSVASPLRTPRQTFRLHAVERQGVQTSRLLAALSAALDLTEGQIAGHAVRTCYLAMRVAHDMDFDDETLADLFYAAMLKDAGCSSNAAAVTRIFGGDDIALKGRQQTVGRGILEYAAFTIRNLPTTEPLPLRLRRLVRIGLTGMREHHLVEQLRCERGAAIARKAGFSDRVGEAIHDLHEHWDGKGQPRGLARDRINPLARILATCQGLDIFRATRGRAVASRVLRERSGSWYDPDVSGRLLDLLDEGPLRRAGRPGPRRAHDGPRARAPRPDLRRGGPRPDRLGLRRHRRRQEPAHRLPLAARRRLRVGARRTSWGCRPRRPPTRAGRGCSTTSASSASRTRSWTSRPR